MLPFVCWCVGNVHVISSMIYVIIVVYRPKSSRKKQPSPLDLDYNPDTEGRQRLPPLKPLSAKKRRPKPNSEDYF